MNLAPPLSPAATPRASSPSYSKRTQEEMDNQILHQRLQDYYFQQNHIRAQQKRAQQIQQQQLIQQQQQHQQHQRSASNGIMGALNRSGSSKSSKGSNVATMMAATKAGIVAVGPVPLDFSRMNVPPPVAPQSSPAVQRKNRRPAPLKIIQQRQQHFYNNPQHQQQQQQHYMFDSHETNESSPPRSSDSPTGSSESDSMSSIGAGESATSPKMTSKQLQQHTYHQFGGGQPQPQQPQMMRSPLRSPILSPRTPRSPRSPRSPHSPRSPKSPKQSSSNQSPKSPRFQGSHHHQISDNMDRMHGGGGGRYVVLPALSPIPPSPLPNTSGSPFAISPSSPLNEAAAASSPFYRHGSERLHQRRPSSRPTSPCALTRNRSPSPVFIQQQQGHLARLASRRRSNAVVPNRRTSNFLELPISDYEMRQRRYCSLPEDGYNPRQLPANELYRLRSFSITPNGALIKHGDQIASRRKSRSSAGSTSNTSRNGSPHGSQNGSHEVSPRARSPVDQAFNFPASGNKSRSASQWSSAADSFFDDEYSSEVAALTNNLSVGQKTASTSEDDLESASTKFRVCVLGHAGCGKTALVNQFLTSEYMNTYDASLDDEYGERSVSVSLDGDESELIFIDHTAGEMSVENMMSTYEPHAIIVVYSIIDKASFQTAEETLGYLWRFGYTKKRSLVLVANKVDLERSRSISSEEGRNLARSCEAKFIETSAGIEHNVDELLVGVLKQIRLRVEMATMSTSRSSRMSSRPAEDDSREISEGATSHTGTGNAASNAKPATSRRMSSPLRTLQAARDILTRACLSSTRKRPLDVENLHIL